MNGAEAWEAWEDIAESREDLSPFLMPAWSRALHVRMPRFTPCPRPLEIEGRPAVLPLMSSPWHAGLRVLESGSMGNIRRHHLERSDIDRGGGGLL